MDIVKSSGFNLLNVHTSLLVISAVVRPHCQNCECGCLAGRLQAHVCGLSLQPISCKSTLSVT